jgi:hypothetical protein
MAAAAGGAQTQTNGIVASMGLSTVGRRRLTARGVNIGGTDSARLQRQRGT